MQRKTKLTLLLPGSWWQVFSENRKVGVIALEVQRHRNAVDASREGPSESSQLPRRESFTWPTKTTWSQLVSTGSLRLLITEVKGSFL